VAQLFQRHPAEDVLDLYVTGRLNPAPCAPIEEHWMSYVRGPIGVDRDVRSAQVRP
jgi:hypothetical protein